jgi:proline-specific peptidase
MTACCTSPTAEPAPRGSQDVFNQLQQNAWYLPTRDKAARLYVTHIGHGAPVVFLHGGPGRDFNYIIDALRPQLAHHQFILYDQRGSVLSPGPEKEVGKLTEKLMVQDLETLRVALGEDKLTLFAHSYGTVLAMAYFKAHPEHVQRLILAGTLPPSLSPSTSKTFFKAMEKREDAVMARPHMDQVLVDEGFPADPSEDTPEQAWHRLVLRYNAPLDIVNLHLWRQVTGGGVYYNHKASAAIGNSVASWNILATLRAHPIPVTVIQGDHDYVDPSARHWAILARKDAVRLHVIRGGAHRAWIDQPKAFAAALTAGLNAAPAH